VRNYYLFQALLDAKEVTTLQLLYFQFFGNEDDSFSKTHHKLQEKVFSLGQRKALASIAAYLGGKVPYIEHLRNTPFQKDSLEMLMRSDVIVLSELDGFFCVEKCLDALRKKTKIILDCHNIDAVRFESEVQSFSFFGRLLGGLLVKKVQKQEIAAIKKVDHVIVCSEIDKQYVAQFVAQEKICVLPNGVEIADSPTTLAQNGQTILFIGTLSYPPNADGLKYYLDTIHPLILHSHRNVVIKIVGKNPPDWLKKYASQDRSIQIVGFVESLLPELSTATVCICPVRYGSGTRLKILEYMAAGKAVVSTAKGCEGIQVEHDKNILIADSPTDFAQAVRFLLESPKKNQELGKAGFALVQAKYNWKGITKKFVQLVCTI
jgi:glycosyltransferase involved in cell wall biosynthesis